RSVELPSAETLLQDGELVLESSLSWKQGRTFNRVKTYYHKPAGPGRPNTWFCRVSEHQREEVSFEQLWEKLGKDKVLKEKEYIPEVKKVTHIKYISDSQSIWSMYYTFPPPLSPRVFTVLQVVHLNDSNPNERTGIIISIPVDVSSPEDKNLAELEERGKREVCCVEHIKEMAGDIIEWRMATCGDPGGFIPRFVVEKTMAMRIAEDVPNFLSWLHGGSKDEGSELKCHPNN
ncbi:hypothetical protein BD779DRAFT_1445399, partial [Infundibulicybe gibba]